MFHALHASDLYLLSAPNVQSMVSILEESLELVPVPFLNICTIMLVKIRVLLVLSAGLLQGDVKSRNLIALLMIQQTDLNV